MSATTGRGYVRGATTGRGYVRGATTGRGYVRGATSGRGFVMPTPIAIAVVEQEGRFLIGRRPPGAALAGLWEFPGGKIEPGESAEAAVARECLEETGLAVEPLFRYPEREHEYAHDRVQLIFIACRPASGAFDPPREPFRWVERAKLGEYEFPAANAELLECLAGVDRV